MIGFQSTRLQSLWESVISTLRISPGPKISTTSLQEQILEACSGKDTSKLQGLLGNWHEQLLDQYGTTEALNQLLLKEAARQGNVEVFSFLLKKWPDARISDGVRSNALEGGVEIWKAILDHSPELINWDFGERGDPMGMAAVMNNVPLLAFFLDQGLDPNESRLLIFPTFDIATRWSSVKREVLDLLIRYGATKEKSLAANQKWRGL